MSLARARLTAGAMAAVLVTPVLVGTGYSVLAALRLVGAGAGSASLDALARVLGDGATWRSAGWTVATATLATVLATAGAIGVAIGLRATRGLRALLSLPLAVPHAAGALAFLLLLGQGGMLARLAAAAGIIATPAQFPPLVYDRAGIGLVLAFAWKEFPFLAISALAILETRGDGLEEAARTLGAPRTEILRRVTLPLLWRGLLPVGIAALAYLLGQFEMAVLLGPGDPLPLPVLTWERATDPDLGRRADAHVLALLALGLAGLLAFLHGATDRGEDA